MKYKMWSSFIAVTFATLAIPVQLDAQDQRGDQHHHYKVIDVGTFGGPFSQYSVPSSAGINHRGTATGVADTSIPDPYFPNCFFDCWVDHAFVSRDGLTTDLGTLPGGLSSFAYTVNNLGLIVGQSQNGSIDPLTGLLELRGVLWQNGQVIDLGTLGGNESNANAINDRGQVVGGATNATPDPFANVPQAPCQFLTTTQQFCSGDTFAYNALFSNSTTETHAFLWQDNLMLDLGTLGGPDSTALINNNHGQVAGWSYTSFVANPLTGTPTVDPFLWSPEEGKIVDLGGLGGTFGDPFFMNNQGQVVGISNLPGDTAAHPFLWPGRGGEMQDLGTLGGTYGHAHWINNQGEIIGFSNLVGDQAGHAFLWRQGVMTDLGTLGTDPDSDAGSINSQGQIVGGTFGPGGDLRGWLWEHGGPIVDLENLILPGSGLTVIGGNLINDRGEIAGEGILPNGDTHAILLIPCDEHHPNVGGCDYSLVDATNAAQSPEPRYVPSGAQRTSQSRRTNRYHTPGLQSPSR